MGNLRCFGSQVTTRYVLTMGFLHDSPINSNPPRPQLRAYRQGAFDLRAPRLAEENEPPLAAVEAIFHITHGKNDVTYVLQ